MKNEEIEGYIEKVMSGKDISKVIDEIMLEMGVGYGKRGKD